MRPVSLFGLLAMLPAALGTAPAAASLQMPICTGDGQVHVITVAVSPGKPAGPAGPASPADPAGKDQNGCCAKGCHAGSSRKKAAGLDESGEFDPSQ